MELIWMNGVVSVTGPDDALGWTERALQRRCQALGYRPSGLRRILRFRTALLAGQGVPFATTAARAGYADQAHLASEVRAGWCTAGSTGRQLVTVGCSEDTAAVHLA